MHDAGERTTTVVVIAADGSEEVVGRVPGRKPDLALVDALVRMHLVARRRGARVLLRDPSAELRELLELAGLADVLALEARGQAELGEQRGVEEVVQPGDPPA